MKICFFGVGGVGGFFGSLMTNKINNDNEIYFIARGEHMEAIRSKGLLLKKSGGEEEIISHPDICTDTVDDLPICDVIFLSVKSYDLNNAVNQINKIANENTIILPLLNGADISDRIKHNLIKGIILQSCVYVGTHIESPGIIFQKGGNCKIHIGNDIDTPDFDPHLLLEILKKSEIGFIWEENIRTPIWNKYMFISTFGLMTATYNKTLGEIVNDPVLSHTSKLIMQEIKQIAQKLNIDLDSDVVNISFNKASQFPSEAKTSFQRDVEAKGKINEGDLFGGTLIRLAESLNVPIVNLKNVYLELLSSFS